MVPATEEASGSTEGGAGGGLPASDNSGDLSYLDDGAGGDGDEGHEDDSGDDLGESTPEASTPATEEADGSTEGAGGGALPAQAPSTGLSDEGDFDMEREAAEAEADLESDVTPPSYDMRQDLSGAAGTPSPTGVTPASDAGSTSENSGDLSYLDDAAEGDGDEGGEDDSGDDQVELAYLDDDAADPEMSYLEGPGGAEDRGSSEGEADVAEDASGFGSDGGEACGGGEAVVATGAA
jgi:hypothetical protein